MDECSICLEPLKDNIKLLNCNHKFHKTCIDLWITKKSICPLCRIPIKQKFRCKHSRYKFIKYNILVGDDKILVSSLLKSKKIFYNTISKIGYFKNLFIIYEQDKIIKYRMNTEKDAYDIFTIIKIILFKNK